MTDEEILIARLKQENTRLWAENNALRPRISDLEHKLAVATTHLKAYAKADTEVLTREGS